MGAAAKCRMVYRAPATCSAHTCATLMHENGADIRFIQQLLGHTELTTTQIYTQVAIRKLKVIHTATHPAKMGKTPEEAS